MTITKTELLLAFIVMSALMVYWIIQGRRTEMKTLADKAEVDRKSREKLRKLQEQNVKRIKSFFETRPDYHLTFPSSDLGVIKMVLRHKGERFVEFRFDCDEWYKGEAECVAYLEEASMHVRDEYEVRFSVDESDPAREIMLIANLAKQIRA